MLIGFVIVHPAPLESSIAGIFAVKRTPDLLPFCHPIAITGAEVSIEPDPGSGRILVRATVRARDRTGVEMESLTAAGVAALCLYDTAKRASEHLLKRVPAMLELARRAEEHVKGMVSPSTLFEEFGFNYLGPIDGHDLDALVPTLANIKKLRGLQFLHVVTRKGQGYKLAEDDPIAYHGPGKFNPAEGLKKASGGK